MQDFGTKADNSPPPGGQLSAAEFNNLATENENAVLRSGQALSGGSDTQLAQSLFLHGVKSESFQDSGAANAYVATPISGTNGVLLPADYANLNGAVIGFKAAFSNTTASTLNIGQTTGTLIGSKAIRTSADAALPADSIRAGQFVTLMYNAAFDGAAGAWELLPWALNSGRLIRSTIYRNNGGTLQSSVDGGAYANVGSTFTPHPLAVFAEGEALGGGASGANAAATGAGQVSAGPGGGGGGWSFIRRPIASFSGVTISVGAGGTASANQAGGSSAIGALITAAGGLAVVTGPAATATNIPFGISDGGAGSGGDINSVGGVGDWAMYSSTPQSGTGGSSRYGFGPTGVGGAATTGTVGNNAVSPGCGGSGAACGASVAAPQAGGAGAGGLVIIREYA